MNSQQEIMSVCLAVIRGRISPEQARAAILARTTPDPLPETLRLDAAIVRDASQLGRLPEKDRESCLELFKELYDSTPGEKVLEEDAAFGRMLLEQRVVARAHVDECTEIQRRLHQAGCVPLPRLGELLLRKGFLLPGQVDLAPTRKMGTPLPGGSVSLDDRSPESVRKALENPSERFGRYIRVSLLGQGGAGEVWRAWDSVLERWVALKFLKFEDSDELLRLKREAQTAARLSHPNIAAVFEMAEANDRTFLVMELIDGQTLATYPRNDHRKLVAVMRDVALAIQYAHDQGVIHRDIKPGNIMVDTLGRAYIMDFGLARHVDADRATSEVILGTPSYMSPEQAKGGPVDARSDVWSLGATIYELLSDRPPFKGKNALDTLEQVIREEPRPLERIAADLQTIVAECMMKEASRRYARAADVAEDLRRWQEGEAIIAHPPSVLYRLRKKIAKRRAVLTVGLAGVVVSAAVGIWALRANRDHELKDRQLSEEKESRAREAKALALARPHLDEARRARTRLDRLMLGDSWNADDARHLVEKAHQELDRALQYYPAYPDALLEKARMYMTERDRVKALEFFNRAIDATQGYTSAYMSRARILLDQYEDLRHEYDATAELAAKIRSDLKQVDGWSKDTQELQFAAGAAAVLDGQYEKAARVFEEYARGSVSSSKGWEWAGHAWLHVHGMHENAVRDFSEAIKLKPRAASLHVWRGRARLWADRELAEADFRHALELEPANVDAFLGLGEMYLQAGDPTQAMANYDKAVDAAGTATVALVARAAAKLRTQDTAGARADAEEALKRGSRDPAALVVRGRARVSAGDIGGAQGDFEEVLAKKPQVAAAVVGLGDVQRERGNPDKAIAEYERAIVMDPSLADAHHQRGNAERDRGRFDVAAQNLARALELDPSDPYAFFDLGVVLCNQGAWSRAEEQFRKGLELHPTRPDWFWERIWLARSKTGEAAAALDEFRAFVQKRPASIPGKLAPKLNDFLVGTLSEGEFLSLLERSEYSRYAIAEGYFFAAEKALLENRRERAIELFKRSLNTGARTTTGYSTAEVELKALAR